MNRASLVEPDPNQVHAKACICGIALCGKPGVIFAIQQRIVNTLRHRTSLIITTRIHDDIVKEVIFGNGARSKFKLATTKQELDLD